MKDRLIELIGKELLDYASWQTEMALAGNYNMPSVEEVIADKMLSDGWFRPPCKVGDTVYCVENNQITECVVRDFQFSHRGLECLIISQKHKYSRCTFIYSKNLENLDRIKFTKEEAERALRKDEGK